MGNLIVICGPSCSGKSSLQKRLSLPKIVTATTRPPRAAEVDGVDYFFMSSYEFDRMIETGQFIEHSTYDGYKYGTMKSSIYDTMKRGINATVVVELEGVKALKEAFSSNVYVVHLDIDEETLVKRLIGRKESLLNFSNRLHLYREKEQYEHFKPYADISINSESLDEVTRKVEKFLLDNNLNNLQCV